MQLACALLDRTAFGKLFKDISNLKLPLKEVVLNLSDGALGGS